MTIPMRSSIALLAIALFISGCAHYPVNARLAAVDPQTGYRFQNLTSPTNSPELLLMLAFSGGGTRAAALAYGVLEELARMNPDEMTPLAALSALHAMKDRLKKEERP